MKREKVSGVGEWEWEERGEVAAFVGGRIQERKCPQ